MPIRSERPRRGMILLEVLVGLTMLAIAGVAWISLMGQTAKTVRQVRVSERDARAAADDLQHVALWTASDLSAHAGVRRQGSYLFIVQPITAEVFAVTIADTNGAALLTTSVYAPIPLDTIAQ